MPVSNPSPPNDGYLYGKRNSYYVFALLFLLYMFDYIDRFIVAALIPYLKADWALSDMQCGMLSSAVYWSIVLFSFPVSLLVDRWSRRKGIGLMAILWSLATAAAAFTRSFGQLFVAKAFIGIGEAGYSPGGTAMLSALFPEGKRSQIIGFWNASIPLGYAVGTILGGFIAKTLGWRYAFGLVAIPGAVIGLLFLRVRDYKTVALTTGRAAAHADAVDPASDVPGAPEDTTPSGNTQESAERFLRTRSLTKLEIAGRFLRTRSLVLTYVAFAGNMFVTAALMMWLPTFFHRSYGLTMTEAGLRASGIMGMAILGAPLGGYLVDRWRRRYPNARLAFAGIASFITAALLFIAFGLLDGWFQYGVLVLSGLFAVAFSPAAIAVTQDVVHPGLRATSYALCVIVQNLLGSSLGPLFVGGVSDGYGLTTALAVVPVFTLISGFIYLLASRWYLQDLAGVERVEMQAEAT